MHHINLSNVKVKWLENEEEDRDMCLLKDWSDTHTTYDNIYDYK